MIPDNVENRLYPLCGVSDIFLDLHTYVSPYHPARHEILLDYFPDLVQCNLLVPLSIPLAPKVAP